MILVIDNYDSFVYNLARYIQVLGFETTVVRSDQLSIADIETLAPAAIVISPGPCTPNEAGISLAVIKELGHKIPILGICLGHQAIGQAFGATVTKALYPTHGKARLINHNSDGIFNGIETPLSVARYHSLIVSNDHFPADLLATSYSEEGEIMSLQHKTHKIYGLQFHPESVLTEKGYQLLQNFLDLL
jgi:anthranilate synthase/aminodeoxychorismate synthase-like glutamine amidotransferase